MLFHMGQSSNDLIKYFIDDLADDVNADADALQSCFLLSSEFNSGIKIMVLHVVVEILQAEDDPERYRQDQEGYQDGNQFSEQLVLPSKFEVLPDDLAGFRTFADLQSCLVVPLELVLAAVGEPSPCAPLVALGDVVCLVHVQEGYEGDACEVNVTVAQDVALVVQDFLFFASQLALFALEEVAAAVLAIMNEREIEL